MPTWWSPGGEGAGESSLCYIALCSFAFVCQEMRLSRRALDCKKWAAVLSQSKSGTQLGPLSWQATKPLGFLPAKGTRVFQFVCTILRICNVLEVILVNMIWHEHFCLAGFLSYSLHFVCLNCFPHLWISSSWTGLLFTTFWHQVWA